MGFTGGSVPGLSIRGIFNFAPIDIAHENLEMDWNIEVLASPAINVKNDKKNKQILRW